MQSSPTKDYGAKFRMIGKHGNCDHLRFSQINGNAAPALVSGYQLPLRCLAQFKGVRHVGAGFSDTSRLLGDL